MVEEFRIDSQERRRLTTGRVYKPPKYTFFALDAAVQYSGANKKGTVGDIGWIYRQFEERDPDGDFEDWKQFYLNEHGGHDRLEEATEDTYEMFLKLRESIEQIDKVDIRNFIRELVLNGTYGDQNPREAIIEKLNKEDSYGYEYPPVDAPDHVHLKVGGRPVSIQPKRLEDSETTSEDDDLLVFYYLENESGGLTVDVSALNRELDEFFE